MTERPRVSDFHYFTQPDSTGPGTLNPVYEILDHPIVMGGADDVVLTGPAPEKPLIDGREVTDPRLLAALMVPVELDRAEVLDRSAKLGGILRTMRIDPSTARLRIASDVPRIVHAIGIVAAVRIGVSVDLRKTTGETGGTADAGAEILIHRIDAASVDSGRAAIRVVRSRFEGIGATVAGETANLDQAMRDSRVESAEVVGLAPDSLIAFTDAGPVDAVSGLTWLREDVLA